MRRSGLLVNIARLLLPFVVTGSVAAQESAAAADSSKPSGEPPPLPAAAASPAPVLGGFKLSGYAEVSYAYSARAVGSTIVGRLYDRFSDKFTLNALKVTLDRPFAAARWDGGIRADILVGQNAPVLQSSGFSLGSSGDITQLYVTLNVPTPNGNGLQFKVGKFVTLMGLEVIEDVANPNWSEGNQFIFVENFTCTGLEANYKFNRYLDAQIRVSNGWDRVVADGGHKDFMGRVGVYPSASTSVGLVGYYGAQQDGSDAKRYGISTLLNRKIGVVSLWFQGDYGKEQANLALPDPARDAEWWAVGGWLAYDPGPKLGIGLRADYLDDRQGYRTGTAFGLPAGGPQHRLWSATGTLNVRAWPGALVRPEVRYDRSNLTPFAGEQGQVTMAVSVAYLF